MSTQLTLDTTSCTHRLHDHPHVPGVCISVGCPRPGCPRPESQRRRPPLRVLPPQDRPHRISPRPVLGLPHPQEDRMTTTERIHIAWSKPTGTHGRLACPRCPNLDVPVRTPQEGARAIADHIALHVTHDKLQEADDA